MPGRFAVTAGAAVVLAAAAVGVQTWSSVNTPLHVADLKSDPAFTLRMPGADQLAEVGEEGRTGIDGTTRTFAGHIFGTTATSAEVYAFYQRELGGLGWRPDTPPFATSTAELENRQYCSAKASFRLAIKNKDTAFQPAFYQGHLYVTVFDATLIALDPSTPCPRPGVGGDPAPTR